MTLPQDFIEDMRQIMPPSEWEAFLSSFEEERSFGLRFNPLKGISQENWKEIMPFSLEPVPWSREGYFYQDEERPGKHVLHEMGAYYIQEPSAMIVTELLDPKPGEKILDLCAAPGGKSTQIAGRMLGKGLLVSNEIHPQRAKILAQNLERVGARNAVVVNEAPEKLARVYGGYFDRILVDAPCSGEGMFRKEESAIIEWSRDNVKMCHERQIEILNQAAGMLKPGGRLVYATCTFAREEDEETIKLFLDSHPEFHVEPVMKELGYERYGVSEGSIPGTVRMWPHKLKGEGHFAVALTKEGENAPLPSTGLSLLAAAKQEKTKELSKFLEELLTEEPLSEFKGALYQNGEYIAFLPAGFMIPKGIRLIRFGLPLGEVKKNRFEPNHSLAICLKKEECKNPIDLTYEETKRFLAGESIQVASEKKGYVVLFYQGMSVGFGKFSGGIIKNHYPKGLRVNLD